MFADLIRATPRRGGLSMTALLSVVVQAKGDCAMWKNKCEGYHVDITSDWKIVSDQMVQINLAISDVP